MTETPGDSLAVLLHGVGSSGRDLAPLADALRAFLPRTHFVAPDAPNRFDRAPGRQWFGVVGVNEENRPQRIEAARGGFDRVLTAQLDRFGLSGRTNCVALVGFSQGAIMALDALATGRWPIAAVVAFSGRLASPGALAPAAGARALLIHGGADRVIPSEETRRAAERLREAGVDVDAHVVPGLGHGISPEGVAMAGEFLAERLGV